MSERLIQASDTTTEADAKAQHPMLDTEAPAASEKTPQGADTVVAAQTAEEVEAQYVNRAGGPEGPTEEGEADEESVEDNENVVNAEDAGLADGRTAEDARNEAADNS